MTRCAAWLPTNCDCSNLRSPTEVERTDKVTSMRPVSGVVQHYPWGDREVIPRLLGIEPDGEPWAEYWIGTHPRGPATFEDGSLLASETGELTYLLKVLAAGAPLSLQTHPNRQQAEAGFASDVFADPHAKPELLCAITPVTALCGIRPVEPTIRIFERLGLQEYADRIRVHGSGTLVRDLYRGHLDPMRLIAPCESSDLAEATWINTLQSMYPGDPSVAAALLLNLVRLHPGEAIRLDAGHLHAYLSGAGIELMGASDNVVRGGLTTKEVNVDLLLDVLDVSPLDEPVLPAADRHELPGAGVALVRMYAGESRTTSIHTVGIGDDGVAFYVPPHTKFTSTVSSWIVDGM